MKSIVFVLFTFSIVMLVMGYMEIKLNEKRDEKVIEYRFIPRSILDEQFNQLQLTQNFSDMFDKNRLDIYSNIYGQAVDNVEVLQS